VQHDGDSEIFLAREAKEIGQDGEVTAAAHRQKLGQALDDAKEKGF
jgi:hypothetical protein